MSIRDEINSALATEEPSKRLFYLEPAIPGAPRMREVLVSDVVRGMVWGPFPDDRDGYRHSEARTLLDSFTHGDEITVSQRPRNKAPGTLLARVDPTEADIWDFRVPKPGRIRILGGFAETNVFVALTWDYRENLIPKEWPPIIRRTRDAWSNLFSKPPVKGRSLDDYLTDYFDLD